MSLFRMALILVGSCCVLASPLLASDPEIDELPRSTSDFSYYQLGKHVPKRSGWPNFIGPRTVIHDGMGLPLEIDPGAHSDSNKQHMYCNTQVWGFANNGKPTGKSNHIANFSFPWTSTFCERRDFQGTHDQQTKACGRDGGGNLRKSHQGSDCRPPTPEADKYWMVAVEDGTVVLAKHNEVQLVGDSGIKWKYRHGGTPRSEIKPSGGRGVRVTKGTRLAKVTDLGSTSIHLHLESERPAFNDRDNLPSLILAYQRGLGVGETPVANGKLEFDDRFEIAHGTVVEPCRASEDFPELGTANSFTFESYWCHNDSIMGLVNDGGGRKLVYHKPRPGIRTAANRQPILFEGTAALDNLSGKATWYSERCGDRQFQASGRESDINGVKHITLKGKRPSFSGTCDQPRFLDETMSFAFMRPGEGEPGPSPVPSPGPTEPEPPQEGAHVAEFDVRITGACEDVATSEPVDGFEEFGFTSLWCHNGSLMGLAEDEGARKLVYFKPKDSLRSPVKRERVLFDGAVQDGQYRGKALRFNQSCGDPKFNVNGSETSEDGKRTIVLSGRRPVPNSNCSVRRQTDETLKFTFLTKLGDSDAENTPAPDTSCRQTEEVAALNPEAEITMTSLWCYENSIVGLAEEGTSRKFYYVKPKPELREAAEENPLLFDAEMDAGTYAGQFTWPDTVCGSNESRMEGFQTTADGRPTITLQGKRRDAPQDCSDDALSEKHAKLSFLRIEDVAIGGNADTSPAPVCRNDAATEQVRAVLSEDSIKRFSPQARADVVELLICHAGFLADADISAGLRLQHFMAQIATETGGMRRLDENMNYSASRLRQVFGSRVTPAQAQALGHKPRKIANHVYGGRLGNRGQHTNDGWDYRGSGHIQLTGRHNYRHRGLEVGLPLEEDPELARKPTQGLLAATAYWSARNINRPADQDDIVKVRRLVNGGTNGLTEARLWYQKAKQFFVGDGDFAEFAAAPETSDVLEELLVERGFLDPGAPEAFTTGDEVTEALKAYQRSRDLPQTGVLDEDTFYAITDPQEWRRK